MSGELKPQPNPKRGFLRFKKSRLLAALEDVWRLSNQAAVTLPVTRRPGSYARLQAIKETINNSI